QHPGGQREINELHVPVNEPVKLTLTSEDVIHDFFVPAFRIKVDVLPGRYTHTWFNATKVGRYHLFCAQYCGTDHSRMVGTVVVMERDEYQRWLRGALRDQVEGSMALEGRKLFLKLQCVACHGRETQRAPLLEGIYGQQVALRGGGTVEANDTSRQNAILSRRARVGAGLERISPA